jgi:hypothetical protein
MRKLPIPPSTPKICPVIQDAFSCKRKAAAAAISSEVPYLPSGWRLLDASFFSSVANSFAASVAVV